MKKLILAVRSKGCANCIATIVPHLFRINGVKGVRVKGRIVEVVLEDGASPDLVVGDDTVRSYYEILDWRVVELGDSVNVSSSRYQLVAK
ncbi:MAG: hypothetical protein LM557_01005 [Desulfurococcaceae archaeon]|jgi:hypothetical protein|nr:hypothetical protein [Desulfurococcaceae archaeon]MCC6053682.1 hypothetical protein [Desulfurococcaceae archaeon]